MKKTVFIQTNTKQLLGAYVAQYSIKKHLKEEGSVTVEILNVDEMEVFQNFFGKPYLRGGQLTTSSADDLQSFTLSRFLPPERMNYKGRAIVIDPDIFALSDVNELFNTDMQGKALMACSRLGAFDTSVMLLECSKLTYWNIQDILEGLLVQKYDYNEWMRLEREGGNVLSLDRTWNNLDHLDENTKMLHTTKRLTQPWKTGLPIDFTPNRMPKFFGIIPREPIHKLLGKYPTHYLPHPNKNIEKFFFTLIKEMLEKNIITESFLQEEIKKKNVRSDAFKILP